MKRKTLALLSIIVLGSLLVACGSDKKKTSSKEPTPEPSANLIEMTPEPTPEPTPTPDYSMFEPVTPATPDVTEPSVSTEYSPYTFTNLDVYMYSNDVVNVRSLPTTESEKLGKLEFGTQVDVTGQCIENSWYRINYHGTVAYVKNDYLQSSMPSAPIAVNTPAPVATVAPTVAPSATASPATTASASPAATASATPTIINNTSETPLYQPAKNSTYNRFVRNDANGSYYTDMYGFKLEYVTAKSSKIELYTAKGIIHTYHTTLTKLNDEEFEIYACECCNDTYASDGIHSVQECLDITEVKGYRYALGHASSKWMGSDGRIHDLVILTFIK